MKGKCYKSVTNIKKVLKQKGWDQVILGIERQFLGDVRWILGDGFLGDVRWILGDVWVKSLL